MSVTIKLIAATTFAFVLAACEMEEEAMMKEDAMMEGEMMKDEAMMKK